MEARLTVGRRSYGSMLLRHPRRSRTRAVLLQFHLWGGLLIGLYTVLMGLTGGALILRDHWDGLQAWPVGLQQSSPNVRRSLDDILAALTRANPGYTPMGFGDLEDASKLPVLYMEENSFPGSSPAHLSEERAIAFDPATGKPVHVREVYRGFYGSCAYLHLYLGAGTRGIVLNGILGIVFLGLCFSGWGLWWPGVRGFRRALRIRWRARLTRFNWDLHTAGGFWINPVLVLIVFTGVILCLPAPTQTVLAWLSGAHAVVIENLLAAPTPLPARGARTTSEQAFQAVLRHEGPNLRIGYFAIPSDAMTPFDAYCYDRRSADFARPTHIYIDPHGANLLAIRPATRLPWLFQWQSYAYTVHFGTFAGWFSEILWFFLGLTPFILLSSGVWIYVRRLRPKTNHRAVAVDVR